MRRTIGRGSPSSPIQHRDNRGGADKRESDRPKLGIGNANVLALAARLITEAQCGGQPVTPQETFFLCGGIILLARLVAVRL